MPDQPLPRPAAARPVHLVYGFYVNPRSDWRAIMAGQMAQLRGYGLLEAAQLHVVITDTQETPDLAAFAAEQCGPAARIMIHGENRFEFWALHHLWQLARAEPEARIAYFHSKGVSRNIAARSRTEKALTRATFEEWRACLALLDDERIDAIGLFPAAEGWIWFNFWWAKARYLAALPEPVTSDDRYSHELWLSGYRDEPPPANFFSTYSWSIRRFPQRETERRMKRLARWPLLQHRLLRRVLHRVLPGV